MLFHARERLGDGIPENLMEAKRVHLTSYWSTKSNIKSANNLAEASTICQALDDLKLGKVEKAADLLAGRLIALEAAVTNKNDRAKAGRWEAKDEISASLVGA